MWRRALVIWTAMAAVEIVHGALRALFLVPLVGDWRARQIGAVVGTCLLLLVAAAGIRWLRASSRAALASVGVSWLLLMLAFELAAGRLLAGYSWERIGSDYDITRGGLLGAGMLVLCAAPFIAARLRGVLPPS